MDFGNFGQVLLEMLLIFPLALIVVRVMGNRTVGQFSPFDFVLMVGIGDIVGNVALDRQTSILTGTEALVGLLLLQKLLAWSSLKSKMMRSWFEGAPVVLIENGKIVHDNFVKTQFNFDDLRQELHKQGLDFTNIKDIKLARLESCGDFSVIIARDVEPLTKRDLDSFIQSLTENPLSPAGIATTKVEQLMSDMRVVAEFVKQQQTHPAPKREEWQEVPDRLQ